MNAALALCLCLITGLAAAESEEPIVPALPDAWGRIHADLLADARARAERIQVVFIGDSITARWTWKQGEESWNRHFAPLGALNLGVSSDATQHVLWRLQHGALDGLRPKVVLLMIGTNNITRGDDPESIAYGVWTIVAQIRRSAPGARVLVQGIFPRVDRAGAGEQVARVNALLARLDDGQTVRFLDFGARFLDAAGRPDPAVFTDGIHPERAEGFRIWSEAVLPTVTAWMAAAPPPGLALPPAPPAPRNLSPATPVARNDFLAHHERILATPPAVKARCRVLFFGDERLGAWDRAGQLYQQEYGRYGILNYSIWAARPENMLWQVEHGELDGLTPALVVLQATEVLRQQTPERACAGMRAVLRAVRSRLPAARILVLGAFPMGRLPDDPLRAQVTRFNALLSELAEDGAVSILDLGAGFLAADGSIAPGTVPDPADYTQASYARWAEAQREAIRRLASPGDSAP